ncbi:cupin-like domain-containing protein [Sphingomonas nostoxanthinifaciens]|uniref:cupin-like domain-containing protein n=1 Tax=Sphingomonas nostoxanthinifaciens TaxID=2872652 RepID=UPI001CC21FFB|nr:cupin-like domain-containing protein [Sphingomonas nostoxanthinifaciens]
MPAIDERDCTAAIDPDRFLEEIARPCRPIVLRGLVRHWPIVAAGAESPDALATYLRRWDKGIELEGFVGPPEIEGRYYYTDDLAGFNFERRRMRFGDGLALLTAARDEQSPTVYLGSLPVDTYLPGLSADNPLALPRHPAGGGRIWLGHAARVSTHYDTMDNVACVVAGRRRFTLYPPELIGDLYVGPVDHTMAGQPVSLAASAAAGDPRYPRFHAVADQALTAELAPGDALYMPKLWWHQVESTAPVNALLNFWWDPFATGPDAPYAAMLLAMIAIADRPEGERRAWRAFFDHYAFRPDGHPLAHLPPERHGILGPIKANYGAIRARVMQMLRGGA